MHHKQSFPYIFTTFSRNTTSGYLEHAWHDALSCYSQDGSMLFFQASKFPTWPCFYPCLLCHSQCHVYLVLVALFGSLKLFDVAIISQSPARSISCIFPLFPIFSTVSKASHISLCLVDFIFLLFLLFLVFFLCITFPCIPQQQENYNSYSSQSLHLERPG